MSDSKINMLQFQFWLGLGLDPAGELKRSQTH